MIHLNIGSNLDSKYGSRYDNISIAIEILSNLDPCFEFKFDPIFKCIIYYFYLII